ncbi:MAG: phosphoribosyltransferase family protein [Microgenomates group bacterium]
MFLKEIIFPKFCLGCGAIGSYLCLNCRKKIKPANSNRCFYCKKLSYNGLTHAFCLKNLSIDGFFSVFYYNCFLKKIIKNIKYQLAKEIIYELLETTSPYLLNNLGFYKKLFTNAKIQPIPLAKERFNKRGFNQAQIIGKFFSHIFNLPLIDVLERKKSTPYLSQTKDKKERVLIMRGAFALKKNIIFKEKKIIIVDDILTTGATVKEAARVLKRNKVEKVYVFTLARS